MKDSRKEIISWSLYDWANSAFATTVMAAFFPIFFSQYWSYGADSAESTFFLGMGNSLASLLVAVMSPIIGAIADKGSYRKKLLILFAFLGAASTCVSRCRINCRSFPCLHGNVASCDNPLCHSQHRVCKREYILRFASADNRFGEEGRFRLITRILTRIHRRRTLVPS